MTKQQYSILGLDLQAAFLLEEGDQLLSISYIDYAVDLWSFRSLFVEVYYNFVDKEIEKIQVTDDNSLNKYINSIKLTFC
jgi:hypothetical protein